LTRFSAHFGEPQLPSGRRLDLIRERPLDILGIVIVRKRVGDTGDEPSDFRNCRGTWISSSITTSSTRTLSLTVSSRRARDMVTWFQMRIRAVFEALHMHGSCFFDSTTQGNCAPDVPIAIIGECDTGPTDHLDEVLQYVVKYAAKDVHQEDGEESCDCDLPPLL